MQLATLMSNFLPTTPQGLLPQMWEIQSVSQAEYSRQKVACSHEVYYCEVYHLEKAEKNLDRKGMKYCIQLKQN